MMSSAAKSLLISMLALALNGCCTKKLTLSPKVGLDKDGNVTNIGGQITVEFGDCPDKKDADAASSTQDKLRQQYEALKRKKRATKKEISAYNHLTTELQIYGRHLRAQHEVRNAIDKDLAVPEALSEETRGWLVNYGAASGTGSGTNWDKARLAKRVQYGVDQSRMLLEARSTSTDSAKSR